MIKEVDALSKQVDELVVQKLAREEQEEKENEQENFEDADAEEDTEKDTEEQESNTFLANILISEVVVGLNGAKNEFIELYNPNDFDVILTNDNFKLKLVNSNNKITIKRMAELPKTIPAHSYFLLVGGKIENIITNATFSHQLTSVSGVIITDGDDNIKDKVAWGKICDSEIEDCDRKLPPTEAVEGQGIALKSGLKTDQSLGRIWATTINGYIYTDSNDNIKDFELQTPTPRAKNQTIANESEENKQDQSAVEPDQPTEPAKQTPTLTVVINEIAWMGTQTSATDEWIELFNNTNQDIDLTGWILEAKDGTPKTELSGEILPHGFYLLERTDDNTILGIIANQFYTGALGNSGEILELRDNQGNLIDEVICIKENGACGGWQGGDNKTKQTMIRNTNLNWQTSSNPEGTPKAKNSASD